MKELLMERYPEIGFHLFYSAYNPCKKLRKERIDPLDLQGVEILYLYGLGDGHYYQELHSWLHERPERRMIILEEDLGVIAAFLETENAQMLLQDSQVILRYVQEWESDLEELAQTYPCERVQFAARAKDKSKIEVARLKLLRKTAALHALLADGLYTHKLLENVLPNLLRLPDAFYANALRGKFKGIPAVICGAGPSLKASSLALKELEKRALIFAGGSTLSALKSLGVRPHFGMALDPNPEEYERLFPAHPLEMPFLYTNRLLPSVFSLCKGQLGYMKADTGGIFESWMEEKLGITGTAIGPDLGREALSVTTLAIAYAHALGCDPIILTGVDLAYTGMKRYADGVVEDPKISIEALQKDKRATEQILQEKGRDGKPIYTLVKWVMERDCIDAFAKSHPETRFINATEGGLGFFEIPYQSLSDIDLDKSFDLQGKIQTEIQQAKHKKITKEKILQLYREVEESLKRCRTIAQEMLAKPTLGKKTLLESDWQEEIAFDALLQLVDPALERILFRYYTDPEKREERKWQELSSILEHLLSTFSGFR